MIVWVSTNAHKYTHKIVAETMPAFRRMPYGLMFMRRRLPFATYIFTDFDRLSFWELELAAAFYRQLARAGCRVLNDPARALQRLPLLRRFRKTGINDFAAWSAFDVEEVDRFPVFLRTAHAHRGPRSGLIEDPASLATALDDLVGRGYPLSDLIIIEYCAEPLRDGLFRKPSVYRLGERMVACPSVHQGSWQVRNGDMSIATEQEYEDDLHRVATNPFGDHARRAFDTAAIDYGRADIGVVAGQPQVYEINTNPTIPPASITHHSPARVEAFRLADEAYRAALMALDTPRAAGGIAIEHPATVAHWQRRKPFGSRAAMFLMP